MLDRTKSALQFRQMEVLGALHANVELVETLDALLLGSSGFLLLAYFATELE